ncbi:MAG: FAD:protein FMN transferase [Tannerella sp.]|nr:FAD:protein FMN transferase [Tannerella sp.]
MKNFIYILIASMLFLSCKQTYQEESGSVFHTLYQVKYKSDTLLTDKIKAELKAFDLSLNPFNSKSIVSKVNRNEDVEVDQWFTEVFNKSMEVSEKSGGMFDVTVAPLINLWGFGFEQWDSISAHTIDSLKSFVGYRKVRLQGGRVVKDDPRIILNFSAIAKGYSCDVIAALLEREGVNDYMVEIGGEVVTKGKNARGECWNIAIKKPENEVDYTPMKDTVIVQLCQKSGMATSGNYINYVIKDGKRYGHTIDPFTGYPSEQNILSATIIAPDCMTADAYATAFMAMGVEAACRMATQIPDLEYYLYYLGDDGKMRVKISDNFALRILRIYGN